MYLRVYVISVCDLITWICELVCEAVLSVVYMSILQNACVSDVCARARVCLNVYEYVNRHSHVTCGYVSNV